MKSNFSCWYYDLGFRREFRITYKLPSMSEVKGWLKRIFKRKSKN